MNRSLPRALDLFPRSHLLLCTLALLMLVVGCDDNDTPTAPTTDPTPDIPVTTETFSGSFGQTSSSLHLFTVSQAGPVEIRITALAPLDTLTLGMGIGTIDTAGACTLFAQDNSVRLNDVLLSNNVAAGTNCVSIFDVGNIFPGETVTYTIAVQHP